jgi:FAD/FMN-containing dehydrogenase
MYGMGSDNVLEYTVVSTNGSKIWVANNNSETDLFWALRGGGGPSFGVITELVVQIHPVTDPFSYGPSTPFVDGAEEDFVNVFAGLR